MAGGLTRFGQRFRREARKSQAESRERVRDGAAAICPVLTGRMRAAIRQQPTHQGLGYIVFETAEDFREVGQIFYPWLVIAGYDRPTRGGVVHVAGRDFLTPPMEGERPLQLRGLRQAAFRAARG